MSTIATHPDVIARESQTLLQVYRRNPVVFEWGEGCRLYTAAGRGYLDFISGVGVASLGHGNPKLAGALSAQAHELVHTSNLFFHPLQAEVASRLEALSGMDRAFLCNSGTEAVEACLKFARRYWTATGVPRPEIVAFEGAFHGRTLGSLSVTWDDHYRGPFQPLLPGIRFVAPGNVAALHEAVNEQTAAIIVEPIQGEGGVRPLPQATADAIAEVCGRSGALLIADEVQCGLGRTGRAFHSPALGLRPDLMAVGKSLGSGVPVAAALFSNRVAAAAAFGDHGSTYGGNLLACRAAIVFLDELTRHGLLDHVQTVGRHAERQLRAMASRQPAIREVRGAGLMWGIDLDRPAAPVVEAALERGLLVNRTADTVIRLLPPYVISAAELDEGITLLEDAIAVSTNGGQA
jgi:predicted acetylornithine/succinylornithine family transaminase